MKFILAIRWSGLALLILASRQGLASEPLPEPLTLDAALSTAQNATHYDLIAIEQRTQAIRAELGIEQGNNGFSLDLKGRLRQVEPSALARTTETNDSAASLVLSRPIYDFGLQGSRENALSLQLQALELQQQLRIEQRRIEILQNYFAVLNADNQYIAANEALAIGFIRYDNMRQDRELGLAAEIDVLRLQSEYELTRQRRALAEQQQRLTRAVLAETMGYPRQLPSQLEIPPIAVNRIIPQDFESLVHQALQNGLEARVAHANTMATQAAIAIAESDDNPSVEFELEVSHYEREGSLRDDWRASLYFEIPLYSASAPARVDHAVALHRQALADQQHTQAQLRLEVLRLWQEIQQLRLIAEGAAIEQEYRERYLDRSRAEYELEFKTDLGDSMVEFSRSYAERLHALYAWELAWQRLTRLVGADYLARTAPAQ